MSEIDGFTVNWTGHDTPGELRQKIIEIGEELARSRHECDELRKVLQPFADKATRYEATHSQERWLLDDCPVTTKLGYCRAARAALAEDKP